MIYLGAEYVAEIVMRLFRFSATMLVAYKNSCKKNFGIYLFHNV